MAWIPVWESGFETQDQTELAVDSSKATSTITFSATTPRTGSFARDMNVGAGSFGKIMADPLVRFRVGLGLRYNGFASTSNYNTKLNILYAGAWTARRISLEIVSSLETIELTVNGTMVDTIPIVSLGLSLGQYYDFGLQANMVDSASGFVSVYIDGVRVLTYSGAIAGAAVYSFFTGGYTAPSVPWPSGSRMDDIYMDVADGAEPDVAPPTYRIGYTTVNGAGDSTQWTAVGAASNWQAVDDGVPDGDTTHVSAAAVNLLDLYTVAGITVPEGYSPVGVRPIYTARKTDSATDSRLASVIKDGANQAVDTTEHFLPTDYASILGDYHAERPGGGSWTEAAINALQIGQMSKGDF